MWADKLTAWQNEIDGYGIDQAFDAAIAATKYGWDYPPLVKVLQEGYISAQGAWDGSAPWYADDLTIARLNVLEQQERTTEYLYLAEAEGQTGLYVTMLVKLERSTEAVDYAMQHIGTMSDALTLATALSQRKQAAQAIKIADYGLSLHGDSVQTARLARWLRDYASQQFKPDIALKAAQIAFTNSMVLGDYQAIETIANLAWPTIKPDLLKQLAQSNQSYNAIDIYLHEGLVDRALEVVNQHSYISYDTLKKVVDAAEESHPDWVIKRCKKEAESIMDSGKSKYYYRAIECLKQAKRAYQATNHMEQWQLYLNSLISKHARKYSLTPQLKALQK